MIHDGSRRDSFKAFLVPLMAWWSLQPREAAAQSLLTGSSPDVSDRAARLLGITRDQAMAALGVLTGAGLFGGGARNGASVGNFSPIQLWNPGPNIGYLIAAVPAPTATSAASRFLISTVALTTANNAGRNMNFGGAAATLEIRTANPAALAGTQLWDADMAAAALVLVFGMAFARIPANQGLTFASLSTNAATGCNFLWFESTT